MTRKALVKALDKEFSLFIRKRDQDVRGGLCVFPGCPKPIQNCFHIITRAKYSVRWDPANAVASCTGCNMSMEYNPNPYILWYIARNGLPAYEDLVRRSNIITKKSNSDLEEMLEEFRRK